MKFLFWLFFVPLIVFGQSNTIKGTITEGIDSTESFNTFITIDQLNLTTKTDSSGTFSFKDIPDGNYNLIIFKKGFISKRPNPILITYNGSYILKFHLDELPLGLSKKIFSSFSQEDILFDTHVGGSFYSKDILKLTNSLNHVLSKNTNSTLVYQKYFEGIFIYNGVALENNIYLDNVKLSGINPIIYTHLINTNFLNQVEVVGNNGSGLNGYPETQKIILFSNNSNMFDVDIFTSNKNMSVSSYYNGGINVSSALLDSIKYFLSFSRTNNIGENKKDNNIDYPIGDFYNIYGTSQFVINQSQSFNLSYFFVEFEQASTITHDPFYNFYDISSQNYNLVNINFNSHTKFGKSKDLLVSFTYNKSKINKNYNFSQSNNSGTVLTSLIKYNGLLSSNLPFTIGFQNNYYITDYSNSQYFDRDNSLNMAFNLQLKELSISPFFSLLSYDKNKFLSLPGVNIAYKTSDNSNIIFNYSIGYNKRNAEETIEYNYMDNTYWETIGKYRPELYKNLSVTFRYTDLDFYYLELSVFQINYDNVLRNTFYNTNDFLSYQLVDYDKVITKGSSIDINIAPSKYFSVSLNYTLQDVKNSKSKDLILRPIHSGFASIKYNHKRLGIYSTIELQYYGDKYNYTPYTLNGKYNIYYVDANEFKTSDALITNVYFEKEFGNQFAFTIGAYNIFDHKTENYCGYQSIEYFLKVNYSL